MSIEMKQNNSARVLIEKHEGNDQSYRGREKCGELPEPLGHCVRITSAEKKSGTNGKAKKIDMHCIRLTIFPRFALAASESPPSLLFIFPLISWRTRDL
jgi:hypothetical protein